MGRDGAEGAATETSAMKVYRVLYHLVGGYALVLVFGMRQTSVWQVERGVKLLCGHRRIRRIDNGIHVSHLLNEPLCVHLVRLFFDMAIVLCLRLLVLQTFLMGVQHDVIAHDAARNIFLSCEEYRLRQIF